MKRIKKVSSTKRNRGKEGSGESNYGRKRAYLLAHGGTGLDYPDKPWRGTL